MKKRVRGVLCLVLALLSVWVFLPAAAAGSVNVVFTPDRSDYVFTLDGWEGVTVSTEGVSGACQYTAYAKDGSGTRVWSRAGSFSGAEDLKLIPYNKKVGCYTMNITVYAGDRVFKLDTKYSVLCAVSKSDVLGIQNGNDLSKDGMVLDMAARAGMGITRLDLLWNAVETQKGQLSLSGCAKQLAYIRRAQEQGMEVMAILGMGNTLYTKSDRDLPVKGTEGFQAYLNYCDFVVRELQAYGVKYFNIWNEPNSAAGQTATSTGDAQSNHPEVYADLLNAAAPVIRAANPEAVIIAGRIAGGCSDETSYSYGGYSMSSEQYIEGLFQAVDGGSFDIFSIHPYMAWEGPPDEPRSWHKDYLLPNQMDALETLMNRYHLSDKPIWITELGYSTSLSNAQSTVRILSEETKAVYNARHGVMALADGRAEKIVYHVSEYSDNFGFFESRTLTPRDSYFSVATMHRFLQNKTARGKVDAVTNWNGSYSAYLFGDESGKDVVVAWARGNAAASAANVTLSAVLEALSYTGEGTKGICYDFMGNNPKLISAQDTLTLDCKPVYILLNDLADSAEAVRNGELVTVTGQSTGAYVGVAVLDSQENLLYINQIDTEADGTYQVQAEIDSQRDCTVWIRDGEKSIPFEFLTDAVQIEGLRNEGEDAYLEKLEQMKDGTVIATVRTGGNSRIEEVRALLTFYTETGILLKTETVDVTLNSGEGTAEIRFENTRIPEGCGLVKCMLWNSMDTMRPTAKPKILQ